VSETERRARGSAIITSSPLYLTNLGVSPIPVNPLSSECIPSLSLECVPSLSLDCLSLSLDCLSLSLDCLSLSLDCLPLSLCSACVTFDVLRFLFFSSLFLKFHCKNGTGFFVKFFSSFIARIEPTFCCVSSSPLPRQNKSVWCCLVMPGFHRSLRGISSRSELVLILARARCCCRRF
jgi:hypothetical protein